MICAAYCVHDDNTYLRASLGSVEAVARFVFISKVDWTGKEGDWKKTIQIAEEAGAEVVIGEWDDETSHRRAALQHLRDLSHSHAITIDSDEVIEPLLLDHLIRIAESDLADRVHIRWDTYWKDAEHVVRPREPFSPCIMIALNKVDHQFIREYTGGRQLFLNESFGIVHHLSYAGGDERIWKKINTWSHRDEITPNWWQRVWKAWDQNPLLQNLHPTHPENYRFVEHIHLPEILKTHGLASVAKSENIPNASKCDIVIPTFGQQELLDDCLASLRDCDNNISDIIVVDDGSPEPITVPDGVILIRLEENQGFAAACNAGFERSNAELIVFLNSDTVVSPIALAHLLASLEASGSIGAAGPFTNYSSHFQQVPPTYTSMETLGLFAQDFARHGREDIEVDMLVGFCFAAKRSVLNEVGTFDTGFGIGTFEDNDLSYRILRAGYRLVLSAKSFIHHVGSKSLRSTNHNLNQLLSRNEQYYRTKWQSDIESGFATHLSGISTERIRFNQERKPEKRIANAQSLAEAADISLCMIVRDEEQNIRACLESVKPFVREMLVLDTGSKDTTPEIAEQCGAIVRSIDWPDSFAKARTESMRDAKGKWILWVDADDTMPLTSGETIMNAVLSAPEEVMGFIVKVRFLESQGSATEVDHVKVFRNYPDLEWEGYIHEQIIASLRAANPKGILAWTSTHVLHSGYDNSDEGQEKKRRRDKHLLRLDLKERPRHPFALFNLGMTAHYLRRHRVACGWFRRCTGVSGDSESHLRKAYALWVGSLKELGKVDAAAKLCDEALRRIPNDPELLFLLGQLMATKGDHQSAIQYYQASLKGNTNGVFTSVDPGIRGWKALHNVALSHIALGDWPSAKSAWLAALNGEGRLEAAAPLFKFAIDFGDLQIVRTVMDWVRKHQGEAGLLPGMLGELSQAVGIEPTQLWQGLVHENPHNDEARRLLALSLLNSSREQEAVPHLDLLQRRGHRQGADLLSALARNQGDIELAERWQLRARELQS
ncbi:MAG: glycosyltransferase [Fimbriimonadaceae bacterium]|nr:glycosyltransferase [Fimbriimonadaceae bacterium]